MVFIAIPWREITMHPEKRSFVINYEALLKGQRTMTGIVTEINRMARDEDAQTAEGFLKANEERVRELFEGPPASRKITL